MADVGDRFLGKRLIGQDGEMADAIFEKGSEKLEGQREVLVVSMHECGLWQCMTTCH